MINAAEGNTTTALARLDQALAESAKLGIVQVTLDARLEKGRSSSRPTPP